MDSRESKCINYNRGSDNLGNDDNQNNNNNKLLIKSQKVSLKFMYNSFKKPYSELNETLKVSKQKFINKTDKNTKDIFSLKMNSKKVSMNIIKPDLNQNQSESFSDIKLKSYNEKTCNLTKKNTKKNEDNTLKKGLNSINTKKSFIFNKGSLNSKELKTMGKELIRDISTSMNLDKEVVSYFKQNYLEIQRKMNKNSIQTVKLMKRGNGLNLDAEPKIKKFKKTLITSIKREYTKEKNEINEEKPSSILIYNHILTKNIWDFTILLMILYSVLISPIHLAFYPQIWYFLTSEAILELFFILDLLSGFITTYNDIEETTITKLSKISENYFFSWFFIDLISSIPIDLFFNQIINFERPLITNSKYLLKLNLFKWIKMIRIFKVLKEQTTGRFLDKITFNENNTMNRILKFVIIFFILSHMSSCFFIYLGLNSLSFNNWIDSFLNEGNYFDIYIASLYYNLVTIYSVGYGDIIPVTVLEKFWVIIFMMSGSMLYSYAVSSLSTVFSDTNNKYIIYRKKVSVLESINLEYMLPNMLYNKILKTLHLEYRKNRIERYGFLESLPSKIKNDLIYLMYEETITQQQFFKNKPHDFILYVLPLLKFHKVGKDDVLISLGNIIEEMYFVMKGTLCLNLGIHYKNFEILQILEKNHYGDLFLQLNQPSPYELKCKSLSAEVLVLTKEAFLKTKSSFGPLILDNLEDSYKVLEKIDKKRDLIYYFFNFSKEPKVVKAMINHLHFFLFSKEFDSYFNYNVEFQNPLEFLSNKDSRLIHEFIISLQKENQKYMKTIKGVPYNIAYNTFYNIGTEIMDIHNAKPIRFLAEVLKKNAILIGNKRKVEEEKKSRGRVLRKSFRKTLFRLNLNLKKSNSKEIFEREKKINKKTMSLLQNNNKKFNKANILNKRKQRKSITENMLFKFGEKFSHVDKVSRLRIERSQEFEITCKKRTSFSSENLLLSPAKRFSFLKSVYFNNTDDNYVKEGKIDGLGNQKNYYRDSLLSPTNSKSANINYKYNEDQNMLKLDKIVEMIHLYHFKSKESIMDNYKKVKV